jgi:hypothetical protein
MKLEKLFLLTTEIMKLYLGSKSNTDYPKFQVYHICLYFHVFGNRHGFGLIAGFIEHLQLVTTDTYDTITNLQAQQITTALTAKLPLALTSTMVLGSGRV